MNEPQHSEKLWENDAEKPSKLRTIANTSKDLFREIAIKSTKSLINISDELRIKPTMLYNYLKKRWFSSTIIDAAMKQAWFAIDEVQTSEEAI